MVDISDKLDKIREMVDQGDYFTISRPRQYGKTTTLYHLEKLLEDDYLVIRTSFEGIGDKIFEDETVFSSRILGIFARELKFTDKSNYNRLKNLGKDLKNLEEVADAITEFVLKSEKPVVLMIDEIDKSSNNQLFLSFLGVLRNKYLRSSEGKDYTFHSVILAGVHDVKNLKLKIRHDQEKKYNSPWNIAIDLELDFSFSVSEILSMLNDYTQETGIDMDKEYIAEKLYEFTSGYPYLVSKLCKIIDEKLNKKWSFEGIQEAINILLEEKNPLFDDVIKNLTNTNIVLDDNDKTLLDIVYDLLIDGIKIDYNTYAYEIGLLYGIFSRGVDKKLKIHNKIFELMIYNYLVAGIQANEKEIFTEKYIDNFIDKNNNLKLEKILTKFQSLMKAEFREKDTKFLEREGRLIFLAFIKPIINGRGFYFVEPETRHSDRMDIVIIYNQKQYIIELKIWRGDKYVKQGLDQLQKYLDSQNQTTGYLVVFNFNKNKEFTSRWIEKDEKSIYEVIV